jgi:hypothetical protein
MDKQPIIAKPEHCIDEMLHDLEHGKEKGTTTHILDIDRAWKWRKTEFNIWSGYSNEGKALHIETVIPTTEGPAFMRDLKVGDRVFDEKGVPCNIIAVTEVMYGRPCYKITFSDNTWIIADANHQWVVDDMQSRASKFRQTRRGPLKKKGKDQRDKCLQSSTLRTVDMLHSLKINEKCNYSVSLCEPVQYEKQELELDPYLLGVWLGDGTRDNGQITSADDEILEHFRQGGFDVTKHKNKYAYGVLKLRVKLRRMRLLRNKHIPWEYLHSSVEDRLALLQGLMDTDGFCDHLGRCEFTSVDWHLAEHVHQLMSSLGIKVYRTNDDAMLNGRRISDRYRLRFKTTLPVFRLKRKLERQQKARGPKNNCRIITSIEPIESVPVKCIEVDSPSHMYLCTEHFIPTHNSSMLRYLSLIKAFKDGWKFLFSAPEDFPAKEFYDDMIHTVAGSSTDRENPRCISRKEYLKAYEKIREHFVFLYLRPPHNTVQEVLDEADKVIAKEKIDVFIMDPLIKFARPKDIPDRDDIYAAHITTICTDFARDHNISQHLVMHQLTPRRQETGFYPEPNMYSIKGGGTWSDGTDNILTVWRPKYAKDKLDTEVWFSSQKIKKQKLVGIPQTVKMHFDRKSNRYIDYETKKDLFDF